MKYGHLVLEKKEFVLLKRLVNVSGFYTDNTYKNSIQKLTDELKSAIVYSEEEMPEDVIRFNSAVTIEAANGWSKQFQLVIPSEGDFKNNKISILTPMGAAVIGYAKGDDIIWEFRNGEQTLKVTEVVQQPSSINSDILM
ncbi:regulator of nucleoside diphosphate kinase [Arenibacter nanhaiticus]|uniref:Regulator of nucleoside diphosphate kinase n=1 Tax=Arenibacter nanhaiticus TaxID=558155 RepID=A0A1M6G6N3_9FLAO|nr:MULTISPECIES: GreA/GreB family elongation factor [Arenibacter]NKI25872.1 transcription elongation factor GreAB [Arenibacter sp. 6A1]SHJ05447.1 regulator of nucleoside diphosphate kinase [Arenibacter nanhaiticus]